MKHNSGQILIVVLLIVAVGLTVGIALITRSISGLKISTQEEESARAFSVAEAGLEEAFLSGQPGVVPVGEYEATVTESEECRGENVFFDFGGQKLAAGETATLWLVGHDQDGEPDEDEDPFPVGDQVIFCWGETGVGNFALEAGLIFISGGSYQTGRGAFDPDDGRPNNFDSVDIATSSNCPGYAFSKTLNFSDLGAGGTDQPFALRLRPVYNSTNQPVAVFSNGVSFPAQGEGYESTATVAGGATVRLKQCQSFKEPPGIFDYALFSEESLNR